MLLSVPKLYDKYSTLKWHLKKYVQFSHIEDQTFHLFQKKFFSNGMDSHLPFLNAWCSYFLKWSWVKCVSFGWSRWVLDGKIINMNNLERLGWNYLVFGLMKGVFEVNLSVNLSEAIHLPSPSISYLIPTPSYLSYFSPSVIPFTLHIQLFFCCLFSLRSIPRLKATESHYHLSFASFGKGSYLWKRHFLFSVYISLSLSLLCSISCPHHFTENSLDKVTIDLLACQI